jgi:hypothetical protein
MLLHCFFLFEFKFMFELNFVNSFCKNNKRFFFYTFLLPLLAHHPRYQACLVSRGPPPARHSPLRLLLLQPLPGRAQWSSPTSGHTRPTTGSDRATPAASLRPWPWAHEPRPVSTSYKAAATSYPIPFARMPSNTAPPPVSKP